MEGEESAVEVAAEKEQTTGEREGQQEDELVTRDSGNKNSTIDRISVDQVIHGSMQATDKKQVDSNPYEQMEDEAED